MYNFCRFQLLKERTYHFTSIVIATCLDLMHIFVTVRSLHFAKVSAEFKVVI